MIYEMIFQTSNLNCYEKSSITEYIFIFIPISPVVCPFPNFCLSIPFVYKSPIIGKSPITSSEKDNPNRYCKN